MRQKNFRLVIVGTILMMAAVGFMFGMSTMMSKSNNPVAMMEIVGQVSGVVGALGLVMLVFGLVGRKAQA